MRTMLIEFPSPSGRFRNAEDQPDGIQTQPGGRERRLHSVCCWREAAISSGPNVII